MRSSETGGLLGTGALWGASFVFQRVLVPQLGPVPTTFLRLMVAGVALVVFCLAIRRGVDFKKDFVPLAVVGILMAALPYSLFAFGAQSLSTAILAVLNATAPMFGAIFAAVFLKEVLRGGQLVGLGLGSLGVAIVSRVWDSRLGPDAAWGVAACLAAAACYGLCGVYVSLRARNIAPVSLAAGGQLLGGVALAPVAAAAWPARSVPTWVWPTAGAFGLLCSALPFLVYMWLIERLGATKALTVTFLIPVFAGLWGWLVLKEPVSPIQWLGGAVILAGTLLVTRPARQDPARLDAVAETTG